MLKLQEMVGEGGIEFSKSLVNTSVSDALANETDLTDEFSLVTWACLTHQKIGPVGPTHFFKYNTLIV